MIITRTPLRISLLGGGTDFKQFYNKHEFGGLVLSGSIDKYTYVSCKKIPKFIDYNNRIIYSKQELTNSVDKIKNGLVRESMKYTGVENLEVIYTSDLPDGGVGSSSSFLAGLLKSFHTLNNNEVKSVDIASQAINIEQNILKVGCGSQDQIATAVGGFNRIKFNKDGIFIEEFNKNVMKKLNKHLVLFYTGKNTIKNVEKDKIKNIDKNFDYYKQIYYLTNRALDSILNEEFDEVGLMLNEYWELKKKLSDKVSSDHIDYWYNEGLNSGAIGGKLIGKGGTGGYLLFYIDELERKDSFIDSMSNKLNHIPFSFIKKGVEVIHNDCNS